MRGEDIILDPLGGEEFWPAGDAYHRGGELGAGQGARWPGLVEDSLRIFEEEVGEEG